MTLNLAQRSFKVVHFGEGHAFWRHSKARVRLYINSNFCSIFNRFGDIAGFKRPEQTV